MPHVSIVAHACTCSVRAGGIHRLAMTATLCNNFGNVLLVALLGPVCRKLSPCSIGQDFSDCGACIRLLQALHSHARLAEN